MHPDLDPAVARLRDREELDAVAELPRVGDVLRRHQGDALRIDVLQLDVGSEGERGQDLQLVGRIHSFDVEGRIGLGVAVGLGLLQDDGEVLAGVGHLREDVVAGAVDDAVTGQDAVGDEPFLDRADQRNAAGDRGLEREGHPALPRLRVQLGAVVREQRFVGGHHVLAGGHRAQDEGARRLEPPDQLDHDLDRGVVEHAGGILDHGQPREVEAVSGPREVGVGDGRQGEPGPRALFQHLPVGLQDLDHTAADRAEPEQPDLDVAHACPSRGWLATA